MKIYSLFFIVNKFKMTNKIVILDNSVELYEHYISDEKWEKTVSFPKGGLTFNISNGTIKFFAYEDYLYRNCIISMQLPIYIVDRDGGVDGEYDDPSEIGEILDRIFPNASGTEIDLSAYLKKREAAETYQPKGDYALRSEIPDVTDFVTDEDLVEALDDYYTKDEVDGMIPSLSGYATQQWVEDQHYITGVDLSDYATKEYVSGYTYDKQTTNEKLDKKLNISDYIPFDESKYYNKTEIDEKISEAHVFDPTQYYNKSQSDTRFALKSEMPSLSGYATQEWVINNNYITNSELQQYIANLQQQINTLVETISGCCSDTGETIYRWITLTGPDDYICSGTTKYEKQQLQQSVDNGATWTNVDPAQYQAGEVLETESKDCGYQPEPQYRWNVAVSSDYICDMNTHTKYFKEYYQVSRDGGQTWTNVVPEQTRRGSVMQAQSTDCGYIEPKYRWLTANPIDDYICNGTTKYYKEYYQISTDNGQTWTNVVPIQTRANGIVNIHSTDCGEPHVADMLMTYNVTSGQSAHLLQGNVSLGSIQAQLDKNVWTELKVTGSGGGNPIYATFNYTDNDAKGKVEWTSEGIHATSFSGTDLHNVVVYDGIEYTQGDVWADCPYLESLELPSTFVRCSWTFVHDCPNLKRVICNAIEPPHMLGTPFENCPKLEAIYVPDNSVEAYKQDYLGIQTWSAYKDIIRPLSSLNS